MSLNYVFGIFGVTKGNRCAPEKSARYTRSVCGNTIHGGIIQVKAQPGKEAMAHPDLNYYFINLDNISNILR